MKKFILFLSGIALACSLATVYGQLPETKVQDEIQALIDVSGSMKQNDPQNLRAEACKLLISLLPEKSKVAIWLFAEKTTLLTHSDAVDQLWKQQALKALNGIHSEGRYTDIEDAIRSVLNGGLNQDVNKHLILLTDGVVDISKDIMVSADSRERILSEWIPKLQQREIKVLTIALSQQADKELLDKLAFDTAGWSETAESAEQLQRLFLKMLLIATPRDSLPLTGNHFAVDGSVKEFSLLVFKKTGASPSNLLLPDRKKIDRSNRPDNVAWLENPTFDLITVRQPAEGDWQLEADTDPANQVLIVTDLQMKIADTDHYIAENEQFPLRVNFTNNGQPITRDDFLSVLTVSLSLDGQDAQMLPPMAGSPGFFGKNLYGFEIGKHRLRIVADGKTFTRETVKDFEVVAAPIRIEKQVSAQEREVVLKAIPDFSQIEESSLVIEASLSRNKQPPESRTLEKNGNSWWLVLHNVPLGDVVTVNFEARAKSKSGKLLNPAIEPVKIDDGLFTPLTHETPSEPPAEEILQQAVEPSGDLPEVNTGAADVEAIDWLFVSAIVLGVNLLMIAGGYFVYRTMKIASERKQQQLLERLS